MSASKDELADANEHYAKTGAGLVQGLTELRAQHKIKEGNAKYSNDFTGKLDMELQATEKIAQPRAWVAKHAKLTGGETTKRTGGKPIRNYHIGKTQVTPKLAALPDKFHEQNASNSDGHHEERSLEK